MKHSPPPETEIREPKLETCIGELITHSADETFAVARSIGERLEGGEIFLLTGELGAGKTVFAKGLAAGLGIDAAVVTSPSFTLINIHEGRFRFYHIDLYRLEEAADLDLGLEEIFEDSRAVVAIEWAERLAVAPARATQVEIQYLGDSERKINLKGIAMYSAR